jgi:hypothetical protein
MVVCWIAFGIDEDDRNSHQEHPAAKTGEELERFPPDLKSVGCATVDALVISCMPKARQGRVIGTVPLGAWETITFVAALRHNKMTAPMVVEGAMTGEMFRAYVEQCLVPTLRHKPAGQHDAVARDRPEHGQALP